MFMFKLRLKELKEKIWVKIAWRLPRVLVYWCSLRLMVHASGGEWGMDHPDGISIMMALKRWDLPAEGIPSGPGPGAVPDKITDLDIDVPVEFRGADVVLVRPTGLDEIVDGVYSGHRKSIVALSRKRI